MKKICLIFLLAAVACQQKKQPVQQTATHPAAANDSALYAPGIAPLTDSIQRFPTASSLYYRRGLLLFNTQPSLALADLEKATSLNASVPDFPAAAGEAAINNELYPKAIAYFRQALALSPADNYLKYRLSLALIENKNYHSADSAVNELAKDVHSRDRAGYLRARMAEEQKDTSAAINYLTDAISLAGKNSQFDAVMELGYLLSARNMPKALQYFLLAAQIDPTSGDPMMATGDFLQAQKNYPAAIEAYKQCILADAAYTNAYFALGDIARLQQRWKEGGLYYGMAAKTAPTSATAYYLRGLCEEKLGNKTAAKEDYYKALSFQKSYPEAQAALDRVKG
ncbi:Tetratricopeptide repeat-containing protein [Chitinophaga costaii]|uniref:Tetratricopeptide repeat-containing protein n=1 Tax=Chitinophaga costaii TaxID=1335309 RepID=A0A1C4CDI4_9BACT|nr:tetratricopeptide repeat protein [Chitinophaga costaii]PUZ27135.1 tetratricopeptide repeat protein [Chitinophaga costaii]SCC17102.1 Tetratricopeptide repeat-containing protein [Chitinophaga costaii]